MEKKKSEEFGRLLRGAINSIAAYEGKNAPIVEDELGQIIGLSPASIQRYKQGYLPPDQRTIKVFAEVAVQRGFLNREWLMRFLHESRYATPDKLLNALCPQTSNTSKISRVCENLPSATYSQFVMRPDAFNEVLEGLQQRSSVVLIVSFGGMGKSSLAREIAVQCLKTNFDGPQFDSAVWVSDKDQPGSTTLSKVLDEIARTLDYPGFIQFSFDEKKREVEQLMRQHRVLVILDNFETVSDSAIVSWLLRLPEPSKVIVTSREYSRAFRNNTFVVDLKGMSFSEASELIIQRLRLLSFQGATLQPSEVKKLIEITGGNPKALSMALGYMKFQRLPLPQVLDEISSGHGELFEDLFERCWSLLDEASRRVLLAMTLFPSSASEQALSASADVKGSVVRVALERLTDMALLDIQQSDLMSSPRYTLHPLVRWYATSLAGQDKTFFLQARDRWIEYFYNLIAQWHEEGWNYQQYERVEPESASLAKMINLCYELKRWPELIKMARTVRRYWGTRGDYRTRDRLINYAIEGARETKDFNSLRALFNTKSRLAFEEDDLQNAIAYYEMARQTSSATSDLDELAFADQDSSYTRILLAQGKLDKALSLAKANLDKAIAEKWSRKRLYEYNFAICLFFNGSFEEALLHIDKAIDESGPEGRHRLPIYAWDLKTEIHARLGQLTQAESCLAKATSLCDRFQYRQKLIQLAVTHARLCIRQAKFKEAMDLLNEAALGFERFGMRRRTQTVVQGIEAIEQQLATGSPCIDNILDKLPLYAMDL